MMITLLYYIICVFTFTISYHDKDSFLQFNNEVLKGMNIVSCANPKFYIDMANIEESKPRNQDKVILYHGQSYGVWLFQLILKEFKYSKANEDWLPLRYESLEDNIDRKDLIKLINIDNLDDNPSYMELGLSVTPNLVSEFYTESAWYFICAWIRPSSSLFFGKESILSSMYNTIKNDYILEKFWGRFEKQKKFILLFIQITRRFSSFCDTSSFYVNFEILFRKTYKKFKKHLERLPFFCHKDQKKNIYEKFLIKENHEGVALQIIIDKNLANQLTYSSQPFGWVEKNELYSQVYKEVKNKEDYSQARLTLNNDFRSFPSRIKIKSIAGIMENHVDYQILKSMIKEMVETNKKKP